MPSDSWDYDGTPWYRSATVLGVMALGLAESVFLFIQFREIMKNRSAEGVSLVAFTLYLFTTVGWLIWAALSHDAALLLTSLVTLVGSMMVLGAIYRFSGDPLQAKEVSIRRTEPDLVPAPAASVFPQPAEKVP